MRFQFLILIIFFISTAYGQEDYTGKRLTVDQCLQLVTQNKDAGDLKEATRYLNTAAITVWENKDYTKAIEYFKQSIELNTQLNNGSGIAKLNSNLGMIYADMELFENSLEYFQKSMDYRQKYGEKTEKISTRINIAVVLNNLKKNNDAAVNLEDALRMATEMNDAAQMKSCYGMLAETYEKAGNQERTMHYFNLYRTFHEMIQRDKVNDAKKETEAAKLEALQTELEKKEKELALFNTSRELALTEDELKKMDKEVRSLMENKTKQELALSLQEREIELDQYKIADAETENNTQKIWTGVAVAGFIGAILFGLMLYRSYRYKKVVNTQLGERNEEIKTLNENLEGQVQRRTIELQKTLANLERRNQDLDQFSHIISHNLRGPVASILGLGNVLNQKDSADPINIEVFGRLQGATKNLDSVVKDLSVILDVRDNQNVLLETVDLISACNRTCDLLQTEIKNNTVKIETNFTAVPRLQSVKPYIESILFNLLSNSIKYRSPLRDSIIKIESSLKNKMVFITVEDNGTGIDQNDLEKIFLPYKRLRTDGEGKGLGLYMVKTQVEALSGTVDVLSEKGKFCIFTVSFPEKTN